jgi:hypothetical protein
MRRAVEARCPLCRRYFGKMGACNLFIVIRNSKDDFNLILYSEITKTFIKIFLEEYFSAMCLNVEIKENTNKLRITAIT